MKKYLVLLGGFLLSSCASYVSTYPAKISSGAKPESFEVASNVDGKLSSKNFVLINFSFKNNRDEWVRVKRVSIDSKRLSKELYVVVGDDLASWARSAQSKLEIDEYNKQLWLAGISSSLLVAGIVANNGKGKIENLVPGTAGFGVVVANDIFAKTSQLERAKLVPPDHIYNPFSVAPGLFSKKWILLQGKENPWPCEIPLEVEFENGTVVEYMAQTDNEKRLECKV